MGRDRRIGQGHEVSFYMWGGSTEINTWIDMKVAEGLKAEYDITLKRVPMDASVFVNKLLAEKQAGREKGVIDLLWINGENFRNAKEAGLLWGPYVQELPNFTSYVDPAPRRPRISVFPPTAMKPLTARRGSCSNTTQPKWKILPPILTSSPPGSKPIPADSPTPSRLISPVSAFLRLAFYHANGGHEVFMDGFDENSPRNPSNL
jgi:putative spermidine/putrescine transport system substrate-binding protein